MSDDKLVACAVTGFRKLATDLDHKSASSTCPLGDAVSLIGGDPASVKPGDVLGGSDNGDNHIRLIACNTTAASGDRFGFIDVRDDSVEDVKKINGLSGTYEAPLMGGTKYSFDLPSNDDPSTSGCGSIWAPDSGDMIVYLYRDQIAGTKVTYGTCGQLMDKAVPAVLARLAQQT